MHVVEKQVYVVALAMIYLKHYRSAATERPMIDDAFVDVDLFDQAAGYPEQTRPIGGAIFAAHAANA